MKKTALLLAFCVSLITSATAQWTTHSSGFSNPNFALYNLSAPNATSIWGVGIDTSYTALNTEFTRSTDGGLTWTTGNINQSLFFHQVAGISAIDANTAWATVYDLIGSQGKIYKTTNGGASWTRQGNSAFAAPDGSPSTIHFFDASNGVIMGDPNGGYFEVQTTTNGGTTFTRVPQANIPAPLTDEYLMSVQSVSGNNVWSASSEGRIFHSSDKGLTWNVYTTGIPNNYITGMAFSDALNGLLLSDNGLMRTADGGQTWTLVSHTGPLHYMSMANVPGAPGTYVSVGFDPGDEGSSITKDHGLTWTSLESSLSHTAVVFASSAAGWSGGVTSGGNDGIHRFTGTVLSAPKTLNPAQISVYPNPGNGDFNLKLDNLQAKNVSYTVTNAIGSSVASGSDLPSARNEAIKIDLSRQPKGIYFLTIKADDRVHTQKLIVK